MMSAIAGNCSSGQIRLANKLAAEKKAVGILIADGKCIEARNYALREGNLDLAEHVSRLCAR
jgi:hypothetical protein